MADKLPLWRLIAGVLVLAAMAGVLLALAPVYFENLQLGRYLRTAVADRDTSDQAIQTGILARAKQLGLPVQPDEIKISHPGGKREVQIRYAVEMEFPLQVGLHFHPGAKE